MAGAAGQRAWHAPTRPRPVEGGELGREWRDDECAVYAGCLATRGRVEASKQRQAEGKQREEEGSTRQQ